MPLLAGTPSAANPAQGSGGMIVDPCPVSAKFSANRQRTVAIVNLLSKSLRIL
jgi:hypothetical protein